MGILDRRAPLGLRLASVPPTPSVSLHTPLSNHQHSKSSDQNNSHDSEMNSMQVAGTHLNVIRDQLIIQQYSEAGATIIPIILHGVNGVVQTHTVRIWQSLDSNANVMTPRSVLSAVQEVSWSQGSGCTVSVLPYMLAYDLGAMPDPRLQGPPGWVIPPVTGSS